MPKRYESMRNRMMSEGRSEKMAKKHAAMIENALRKKEGKPGMSPHHSGKKGA